MLVNSSSLTKKTHIPVLLEASLKMLNISEDGAYIDCTLGEGGHSFEIFKRLGEKGLLISIDQDQDAIEFVKKYYSDKIGTNWQIVNSNFAKIGVVTQQILGSRKVDGILMDLGLSSRQLEAEKRGFSYLEEEQELDMRMDKNLGVRARDLLAVLTERELAQLFYRYGEERLAGRIASAIKKSQNEIVTVRDLIKIIYKVVPSNARRSDKHPARRVFQALRIAVNDELNSLELGLKTGYELLADGGRMCVISFHSLEDRIVKEFFEKCEGENGDLVLESVAPSDDEIGFNPRSRSARLRTLEKKSRHYFARE